MAPKKSTAGRTNTKKAAGMAQPTLAFSQRKPGVEGKSKQSTSASAQSQTISRHQSNSSIDLTEDEPLPLPSKSVKEVPGIKDEKERRALNPKSKEWAGAYGDAKAAMGHMEPIHAGPNTHNQVHHILRVFDMTSKYGPSVGISRLQRWERAKKWGLNPPSEIHSILTTKEGEDDVEYRENVLHAWL